MGERFGVCYQTLRPTRPFLGRGISTGYKIVLFAGKVTVGLASHWPCVADTVVFGLFDHKVEMNLT